MVRCKAEGGLRAERTGSYVSTQGRLTTQQMTIHGQAPSVVATLHPVA